jgi:hypothetical protein
MEKIFENDEEELLNYYRLNNENYVSKRNGMPDMRNGKNRKKLIELKKNYLLENNKRINLNNYSSEKEYNYRREIIELDEEELKMF